MVVMLGSCFSEAFLTEYLAVFFQVRLDFDQYLFRSFELCVDVFSSGNFPCTIGAI